MAITTDMCVHELDPATCSVCKNQSRPPVFVSGRGKKYHVDRDCTALAADRAAMAKRGGTAAPITAARPGSAVVEGRSVCTTCA